VGVRGLVFLKTAKTGGGLAWIKGLNLGVP
jgi:hypothetical protein